MPENDNDFVSLFPAGLKSCIDQLAANALPLKIRMDTHWCKRNRFNGLDRRHDLQSAEQDVPHNAAIAFCNVGDRDEPVRSQIIDKVGFGFRTKRDSIQLPDGFPVVLLFLVD